MFDDFNKYLADLGPDPTVRFIPHIMYRQGGQSQDWSDPGAGNFSPVNPIVQIGVTQWSGNSNDADEIVNLHPYSAPPMAFVQPIETAPLHPILSWWVECEADKLTIHWHSSGGNMTHIHFAWLSIGARLAGEE